MLRACVPYFSVKYRDRVLGAVWMPDNTVRMKHISSADSGPRQARIRSCVQLCRESSVVSKFLQNLAVNFDASHLNYESKDSASSVAFDIRFPFMSESTFSSIVRCTPKRSKTILGESKLSSENSQEKTERSFHYRSKHYNFDQLHTFWDISCDTQAVGGTNMKEKMHQRHLQSRIWLAWDEQKNSVRISKTSPLKDNMKSSAMKRVVPIMIHDTHSLKNQRWCSNSIFLSFGETFPSSVFRQLSCDRQYTIAVIFSNIDDTKLKNLALLFIKGIKFHEESEQHLPLVVS